MAATRGTPDIAVVTKTYGGLEGRRVNAGTRFAVGKAKDGLMTITPTRYLALAKSKLVRPFDKATDGEAAPAVGDVRPTPPQATKTGAAVRRAARARTRQADNPDPPKKISGGSQTGEAGQASSSAPAQASASSTSSSRGRRTPR